MKKISVLFIGNSYTFFNELWNIFKEIAHSYNINVDVDNVTSGGYTLEKMNDVNDQYGSIVDYKLKNNRYDYVILQEQSLRPVIDKELFFIAVRSLSEKIRKSGANPILYETWARKDGSDILLKYELTSKMMSDKLIKAYSDIGKELDICVVHVGKVFYELTTRYPEFELYDEDLSHPSLLGSYVAALTIFAAIFNVSVIGVNKKQIDNERQYILEKNIDSVIFE